MLLHAINHSTQHRREVMMMPAKLGHSQGNMEILQAAADTFLWIACWLVPAISSGPVDNTGVSCVKTGINYGLPAAGTSL
jgi:hypothetical protein